MPQVRPSNSDPMWYRPMGACSGESPRDGPCGQFCIKSKMPDQNEQLIKALQRIANHDGSRWIYIDGVVDERQDRPQEIAAQALKDYYPNKTT